VLEQQCGAINWAPYNPALAPGEARLRVFQAIARGADGILFFRWRAAQTGAEQLHSGVLPHDDQPGRIYGELQAVARELARLPVLGLAAAPVAMLWSEPNRWALQQQPHQAELAEEGPDAYEVGFYQALVGAGLPVDLVPPERDLAGYRVAIAPAQYLVDPALARRLADWVEAGGQLVLGVRSGFKDADNRVSPQGPLGYLRPLVGARVAEWDAPAPGAPLALRGPDGQEWPVSRWREALAPEAGTEVHARHVGGLFDGQPALVSRAVGEGRVWYLGALGDDPALYDWLLGRVAAEAGLAATPLPPSVELQARPCAQGTLRFVLNHAAQPVTLSLPFGGQDLLAGAPRAAGEAITLPGFGVAAILESAG
jgi:beta-galactosidase